MKQYEITFLTLQDPKGAAPIQKEIEALGGKITNTDSIGEKTLAYPIKKARSAFYTTTIFNIESDKLIELNRKLTLKEEILRYLIILHKETKLEPLKTKEGKVKRLELPPVNLSETKPVPEPEVKTETKEEVKVEKPAPTPEPKPKVEEKTAVKPAKKAKAAPKTEPKPKLEIEPKLEPKVEPEVAPKPKPEPKPEPEPEVKPEIPAPKAVPKVEQEVSDEDERLKALDKKLDELLKE